MSDMPVTLADIEAAARRLAPVARRTPLLESRLLNEELGFRLLCKAEVLQHAGSFKFRGAYNRLFEDAGRPVVAWSSGNHAQGVAMAASLLGSKATIVMPADAPAVKRASTEALGASLRLYDREREVREAIGRELAETTGAVIVRPYDDPLVIAGQGTVGLEMAEDCKAMGIEPDEAFVCVGGGGLMAGCATALAARFPKIRLSAAEPQGFDDTIRSLAAGRRLANAPGGSSICDALLAPEPGEITFAINSALVQGGTAVDDKAIGAAMRTAFRHLKLVVEPGGAAALAAAMANAGRLAGRTVLVVLSGGNVDAKLYAEILARD